MDIAVSEEWILQTFAEWLKEQLQAKGWKRAELARRSGLKEATFTYIFKGRKPRADTCSAIARALGIEEEEVFRRAGLLPEKPEDDDKFAEETIERFKRLTVEQRRAVLEYVIFQLRQQQREDEQEGEDKPDASP
jgi:transcriptional regulator with XRE-family HTH domain